MAYIPLGEGIRHTTPYPDSDKRYVGYGLSYYSTKELIPVYYRHEGMEVWEKKLNGANPPVYEHKLYQLQGGTADKNYILVGSVTAADLAAHIAETNPHQTRANNINRETGTETIEVSLGALETLILNKLDASTFDTHAGLKVHNGTVAADIPSGPTGESNVQDNLDDLQYDKLNTSVHVAHAALKVHAGMNAGDVPTTGADVQQDLDQLASDVAAIPTTLSDLSNDGAALGTEGQIRILKHLEYDSFTAEPALNDDFVINFLKGNCYVLTVSNNFSFDDYINEFEGIPFIIVLKFTATATVLFNVDKFKGLKGISSLAGSWVFLEGVYAGGELLLKESQKIGLYSDVYWGVSDDNAVLSAEVLLGTKIEESTPEEVTIDFGATLGFPWFAAPAATPYTEYKPEIGAWNAITNTFNITTVTVNTVYYNVYIYKHITEVNVINFRF